MAARTVPAMPSWTAGQRVLASQLQQITTYALFQSSPPMFSMYQSAAQTIASNTFTQITCDTLDYDTDGGRAAGTPFTYTIPVGMAGRWDLAGSVSWAINATAGRLTLIYRNGSVINGAAAQAINAGAGNNTNLFVARDVACSAGDTIALYGWQGTAGNLNTNVGASWPSFLQGRLVSLASP